MLIRNRTRTSEIDLDACSTVFQLDVARVGQGLEVARVVVHPSNAMSVFTKEVYGGIGPKRARQTSFS